jgi:hypothetical protein
MSTLEKISLLTSCVLAGEPVTQSTTTIPITPTTKSSTIVIFNVSISNKNVKYMPF